MNLFHIKSMYTLINNLLKIVKPWSFLIAKKMTLEAHAKLKFIQLIWQVLILKHFLFGDVKTKLNNCCTRIWNQLLVRTVWKYVLKLDFLRSKDLQFAIIINKFIHSYFYIEKCSRVTMKSILIKCMFIVRYN